MRVKKHIPNFITILNLLSGSIAIILLLDGFTIEAALFVCLAAILDFFDGFFARALKVKSPIGKDLDSLADVISFGLTPAMFLYYMISNNHLVVNGEGIISYSPYLALIVGGFSALRLAKFNNDLRQSHSFIGLPTPANALLVIPLVILAITEYNSNEIILALVQNFWFQILIIPISCFLLISEIPLISFKFSKGFALRSNYLQYTFITFFLLSVFLLGPVGISVGIVFYILISAFSRKK
jgi:CDP-diacylglycerol--serine O-phosphatidyltransferase